MTSPIKSIAPVQFSDVASTEAITPSAKPSGKISTQAENTCATECSDHSGFDRRLDQFAK